MTPALVSISPDVMSPPPSLLHSECPIRSQTDGTAGQDHLTPSPPQVVRRSWAGGGATMLRPALGSNPPRGATQSGVAQVRGRSAAGWRDPSQDRLG